MNTQTATGDDDATDVEQLRETLALQRRLIERLRREREDERAAVARAVHDSVGQTLSAMKMQLHESGRNASLPEAMRERLHELEDHVDTLLVDARRIASKLRPGVLDHFGLASALEAALDRFGREHGIEAGLECQTRDGPRLPADVEVSLLRIVEGALDNVAAHAEAGSVSVALNLGPDEAELIVRDDGKGFDVAGLDPARALGLLDVRMRAEALGGTCHIESAPGQGTTLRVRVPVHKRDNGERAT